jgi:phosphoserine phosphatase
MPRARASRFPGQVRLSSPGWTPEVRAWLEDLMQRGAGRGLPVAFDFDNTLVCGDIGEATLALLVKQRRLKPETVAALTPPFRTAAGRRVVASRLPDLTAYYEALLEGGGHGDADPNPLTSGYAWAAEIMAGLSPARIVQATAVVAGLARPGESRRLEVTPGETAYPLPWFYPEMIELVAALLKRRFEVWIVSASNVWSVRGMVLEELNPGLQRLGCPRGVAADHVIGVAPLLRDRQGRVLKDRVLVRTDAAYARLESRALAGLRLTSRLDLPVPVYAGKVACLWDALGGRPCLAAGDSPGDLPMLAFAENRLWVARLEKPDYTAAMLTCRKELGADGWAIQPALTKAMPGFLAGPAGLTRSGVMAAPGISRTLAQLGWDWT